MVAMGRRELLAGVAGMSLAGGVDGDEALWPADPEHEGLVARAQALVDAAAARVAADPLRPAFHFAPPSRFMNDPNGPVLVDGVYHIFYQHLPTWGAEPFSGAPGWGHASSTDLVRWRHWPIALMPKPGGYDAAAVASGACVVADGHPTIVYTSVPPQAQSLARSFDGMRTWRRYARNPVVAGPPPIAGLEDGFRDPFVWREGRQWRMLVGSGIRGVGGAVLLYGSPDLLQWDYLGVLCRGMGPDCFQWECPNFFPLGDKWALVVSPLLHSEPALRGPVQVAVGDYDGRRFTPGEWRPMDLGGPGVYYAPNSLRDARGRRVVFGWIMGGGSPGVPWDGLLTVPREISLGPDGLLRVRPVREIETLRGPRVTDWRGRTLEPGKPLEAARGVQLDASLEVEAGGGALEMRLFASTDGERCHPLRFEPSTGALRFGDKSASAGPGGPRRTLRLLLDRSVIELTIDGREAMTVRAHPAVGDDRLLLAADGASVRLRRLQAWPMASA